MKHEYKLLSSEQYHGMFKAGQSLERSEFQNTCCTQMYQVKYAELHGICKVLMHVLALGKGMSS